MTTLADVVTVATLFSTDFSDLKGNTWARYGGNITYPRVFSGYLQIGIGGVSMTCDLGLKLNPYAYRSWQIQFDIYLGSLGSSGAGAYPVFSMGNVTFNWRSDNVANRMGVMINNSTVIYMAIAGYTNMNTVTLECHDGWYYLYLNATLMAQVFANGIGGTSGSSLSLCGNTSTFNSLLRYNNVRLIQGMAPLSEALTDPGFTSTATPRTLLDPATLTAPGFIKGLRPSSGIRRAPAAGIAKPAPVQSVGKRIVPNADHRRLGKALGTVKIGATAVSRPVVLIDRDTMKALASMISDSGGNYRFDYVPMDLSYIVMAKDTSATYNAVIADRVTPVGY